MLKYILQFGIIGTYYFLFYSERLNRNQMIINFVSLIFVLFVIDVYFRKTKEKFTDMSKYVDDIQGTLSDNLEKEIDLYPEHERLPTVKRRSEDQRPIPEDYENGEDYYEPEDDYVPYKDEGYASERLGKEVFSDPEKLRKYVQETKRMNKAVMDNQDIYEEDDEDEKIPVYTQYGFHYMPPTKWKVPQPRPPVCYGQKECPVCPMLSGGSKFVDLLTNQKVVPNDKFDNMYKNMVRKQRMNKKRRWRMPKWEYPSRYEKDSNYNYFY